MTANERATEVMQAHFGFKPFPADWLEDNGEGQRGLALCIAEGIDKAVVEERDEVRRLRAENEQLKQERCPHMVRWGRLCMDPDED